MTYFRADGIRPHIYFHQHQGDPCPTIKSTAAALSVAVLITLLRHEMFASFSPTAGMDKFPMWNH